jgi:hypothetical protein
MASQAAQFLGAPVTPGMLKAIGREYDRVANPSAGAFKRCVLAVAARGSAKSPAGVCATAGRKKYGKKQFQKMAAAGKARARKNPGDIEGNARVYEDFHGRPPDEVIEVVEQLHEHSALSGIGKLVALTIAAVDGKTIVEIGDFGGALLAQDKGRTQLFVRGGNQAVNVKDFGIDPKRKHEQEILGAALEISYETRKDHLGKAGGAGERAIHVHEFSDLEAIAKSDPRRSKGSRLPIVLYDTRNKKLAFAGGGYDLPDVGIRG